MHTTEQLNSALAGRYTIERRIGEGGMATVYLVRDVKHNRKVALKVLKPDLGAIVGVDRFLSEIEVTANLQHPNLLPLFDSGAAEGLLFYVMPYVEGESLRARLEREKLLPVDESVRIATAVASALDYAHRRGVIHRDLKPENILLHDGQPLVADFGIALAVSNAGGDRVTQTGLSLGTPRYMSPEQATGDRAIDARTDIYSLGAVTYEMLTGDPPHTGSSSQAIIARVLTERPRSIRSSRPNVPPHVEASVERALEKLAADRFESAREFSDALTGKVAIATSATAAATASTRAGLTKREQALLAGLGVAALAIAGMAFAIAKGDAPAEMPQVRFDFETPVSAGPIQNSISPDGSTILYGGLIGPNQNGLWARSMNTGTATVVPGASGFVGNTFWKPDSREFAFFYQNKLRRITLATGSLETISDVTGGTRGGTWNANDVIVFSQDGALYRVAVAGGVPAKIDVATRDSLFWHWPWFLPDGEHFLVVGTGANESTSGVYVASLNGGAPVRVMSGALRVHFSPPNYLLFVREEALYAQSFDTKRFEVSGDPVRIIDEVGTNVGNASIGIAVSATGVLVKRGSSGSNGEFQLHWFSRSGEKLAPIGQPQAGRELALSPDGRRIAFTRPAPGTTTRTTDIWILDVSSNITSRLVSRTEGLSGVLWTHDSRSVTYLADRNNGRDSIFSRRIGGSFDSLVFAGTGQVTRAEDYGTSGQSLLLREVDALRAGARLFSLDLFGQRQISEHTTFGSGAVDQFRLSPDGRFVSYNTRESGAWQVWVASFPSFENRRQVSANGGVQARWRGDSKELFYLSLDGKVMAASLVPGLSPEFKAPTMLFDPKLSPTGSTSATQDQYDVTKDGQRFLFPVPTTNAEVDAPHLTVVLNWTNAMKKK